MVTVENGSEWRSQVVLLGLADRLTSPQGLRWSEAVLATLAQLASPHQRDIANRVLIVDLIGSIQFEHFGQLAGAGTAMMTRLPSDEHPLLSVPPAATSADCDPRPRNEPEYRLGRPGGLITGIRRG